tara:strand:- start:428 stop:1078 length:651 start_codon:yes stop_codon:yes gene_type:complete
MGFIQAFSRRQAGLLLFLISTLCMMFIPSIRLTLKSDTAESMLLRFAPLMQTASLQNKSAIELGDDIEAREVTSRGIVNLAFNIESTRARWSFLLFWMGIITLGALCTVIFYIMTDRGDVRFPIVNIAAISSLACVFTMLWTVSIFEEYLEKTRDVTTAAVADDPATAIDETAAAMTNQVRKIFTYGLDWGMIFVALYFYSLVHIYWGTGAPLKVL